MATDPDGAAAPAARLSWTCAAGHIQGMMRSRCGVCGGYRPCEGYSGGRRCGATPTSTYACGPRCGDCATRIPSSRDVVYHRPSGTAADA